MQAIMILMFAVLSVVWAASSWPSSTAWYYTSTGAQGALLFILGLLLFV